MSMSEPGQGRARGRGRRGRRPPTETALDSSVPPISAPAPVNTPSFVPSGRGGRGRSIAVPAVADTVTPGRESLCEFHGSGRGMNRGSGRQAHGSPLVGQVCREDQTHGADEDSGQREHRRRPPWERYIDPQWHSGTVAKTGTSGRPGKLLTNYINVSMPQTTRLYQYHVSFKPEVESIKIKFGLVYSLSEYIGNVRHFDGSILFLTRLLETNPLICKTVRTHDGVTVEVAINYICDIPQTSPQFLQIANGLLNKVQEALNMKRIRDHYFNMHLSARIPSTRLEVMPGFTTAIGKFDGGSLMNLDIIHKILPIDTLYDAMTNLYETKGPFREHEFEEMCERTYIGSIVLTSYNNKTYRVDGFEWDRNVQATFDKKGTEMSFLQYYKDNWNIEINDKTQPLIITKPTERDVRGGRTQRPSLVPELCVITGFDEKAKERMGREGKNQLALHTRIGPQKRVETIESFLGQINSSKKVGEILNPWGMSIGKQVMTIPGRVLNAEELLVGGRQGNSISYESERADWSHQMRGISLLNPASIDSWLLIYPDKCKQQAIDLNRGLMCVAKGFGIHLNHPRTVELHSDRNEAYLGAIRGELTSADNIVVLVFPNEKKDRYDAVKKCLCIEHPVPSQVVLAKSVRGTGFLSIASKIIIQMNCKVGGELWGAVIPTTKLMTIGIDTYHDSLHKSQSIGAMVASLNRQCTRFYSRTEVHDCKVETMNNLTVLVSAALHKYHAVNGTLPDKIVVYRDGVGDGQLKSVFTSEKEQLDQAFSKVSPNYKPRLAYVVVKKRISTRFFLESNQSLRNPIPGTVVDSAVTKPDWYDFFLVSQSVRQGTVTPTSYNVIYDTTGFIPDHMQRLAYKMTHLYFNWQGTIRVPAVCQYAHKLAYLQGQSLHREPSASLADKLYYL